MPTLLPPVHDVIFSVNAIAMYPVRSSIYGEGEAADLGGGGGGGGGPGDPEPPFLYEE